MAVNFNFVIIQLRQMQDQTIQRLLANHACFAVLYRSLHGNVSIEQHIAYTRTLECLCNLIDAHDVATLIDAIRDGDVMATLLIRDVLIIDHNLRALRSNRPVNEQ